VGTYRYQRSKYCLLVDGQTGKVGGIKPRDPFKVWMKGNLIILVVVFLAVIAYLEW
jgi:hypothetical protein